MAIAAGKFHGVTSTETPTGCRVTRILLAPAGATARFPSIRTASSAYQRKNSAAYVSSARASRSDLPFSADISRAICSPRSVIRPNARRRHSARCRGGVAAHPGRAAYAALTASRASSSVASATSVSGASVAGSITSMRPPWPWVHSPPISRPVGTSIPVREARSLLMISRLSGPGPGRRCRWRRCARSGMRPMGAASLRRRAAGAAARRRPAPPRPTRRARRARPRD